MTFAEFQNLAQGLSALGVAGAAWLGVSKYSLAAAAEVRQRQASEIETEVKVAQQFDALLKTMEGFGETGPIVVGLTSQKAAIHSIARIVRLHPKLKRAALSALETLAESPNIQVLHPDLNEAISDIRRLPK